MTQRTASPFSNLNRLIAMPTASQPAQTATVPPSMPKHAPNKLGNKETSLQSAKEASVSASPTAPDAKPIPLTPEPPQKHTLTRKQTFEFTKSELDFLAEVKFQLRDLGVTKNEIVQTGLELVAKDYAANRAKSYLMRKFASRHTDNDFV